MKFIYLLFLFLSSSYLGAETFDALLSSSVVDGQVDYTRLKKGEQHLDAVLAKMETADVSSYSKSESMTFWINAYNLGTLKLILNHYPLKSIKDIPRSKRWIAKIWTFAGQKVSLDAIEHEILRPMGDPRIHFAINCASESCPVLIGELYDAKKLERQLQRQTKVFLADTFRGVAVREEKSFFGFGEPQKRLEVSKIFNWFTEDFVEAEGSVVDFLSKHGEGMSWHGLLVEMKDADLRFLAYDWTLNGH